MRSEQDLLYPRLVKSDAAAAHSTSFASGACSPPLAMAESLKQAEHHAAWTRPKLFSIYQGISLDTYRKPPAHCYDGRRFKLGKTIEVVDGDFLRVTAILGKS